MFGICYINEFVIEQLDFHNHEELFKIYMSDLQLNSVAWDKSPKRYYDLAHAKKEIKTKDDRTPEEIIEDFLNAFKKGKEEEDGIT